MNFKIKAALLSYAKPILFDTEMACAILEGIKTETRRVVKFKAGQNPAWTGYIPDGAVLYGSNNIPAAKAPYHLGDILYVRETWQFIPCIDCRIVNCGETPVVYEDRDGVGDGCFTYRADYPEPERICWRPSIHMPKEAARIFLRVTGVRAERLQDITGEGCQNEGIAHVRTRRIDASTLRTYGADRFAAPWDSAIKCADLLRYGWEANPWVWVIEFKRIEVENDER